MTFRQLFDRARPSPFTDWAPVERTAAGVVEIAPGWVASHAGEARLIDVREADEFSGPLGHVPGSELVPLAMVEAASATWEKDAPLVLICRSGGRSGKAALLLEAKGFTRVASMRGGMLAWNDLRSPIGG